MARTLDPRLDNEIQQRLKLLAKRRRRSVQALMRAAIVAYLDREEGREREKDEDRDRWTRYLITGEAVTHRPVAEWLDRIGNGAEAPCPR